MRLPSPPSSSDLAFSPGSVSDQGNRKALAPSLAGAGWAVETPLPVRAGLVSHRPRCPQPPGRNPGTRGNDHSPDRLCESSWTSIATAEAPPEVSAEPTSSIRGGIDQPAPRGASTRERPLQPPLIFPASYWKPEGHAPMRVLIVEDEVRLADNLAEALRDGPGCAVDR